MQQDMGWLRLARRAKAALEIERAAAQQLALLHGRRDVSEVELWVHHEPPTRRSRSQGRFLKYSGRRGLRQCVVATSAVLLVRVCVLCKRALPRALPSVLLI